ncbi:MAG: diguanylate cyclase [Nitrospirota bacterium]
MPKVLLVDFPLSILETASVFLSRRGFQLDNPVSFDFLFQDSSLCDIFGRTTQDSGAMDVVLIYLEGETAIENTHLFLDRVRGMNSTVCVILVGGEIKAEVLCMLLREGVYDYLSTPILFQKLEKTIEKGLQTKLNAEGMMCSMSLANERLLEEKARLQIWNRDLARIYQINQTVASFLNPGLTVGAFSETIRPLISYQSLSLFLKGRGNLDRVWVFPQRKDVAEVEYLKGEGELLRAAFFEFDEKSNPKLSSDGNEVMIPLIAGSEKLGVLRMTMGVEAGNLIALNEYQIQSILMISTSLSLSLRNAEMYQQVKELATTDELTHILNRRAFLNILERELKRADRLETTLALFLIDLDHFKEINDLHGHIAGDEVLREIALLLRQVIREIDVVARYGGEEFVIILPEVNQKEAEIAAERMRQAIESHLFRKGKEALHLSVSIGISIFPFSRTKNPEDLFHLADVALYIAKKNGRNRIQMSPSDLENIAVKEGVQETDGRSSAV